MNDLGDIMQVGHEQIQSITQTGCGISDTMRQVQPAMFWF